MGYIIPYTHYTYQQYARRMEETKESPHHVYGTYKAVFHQINEDYPYDRYKHIKQQQGKKSEPLRENAFIMTEMDRIALTGKGGHLNESI